MSQYTITKGVIHYISPDNKERRNFLAEYMVEFGRANKDLDFEDEEAVEEALIDNNFIFANGAIYRVDIIDDTNIDSTGYIETRGSIDSVLDFTTVHNDSHMSYLDLIYQVLEKK